MNFQVPQFIEIEDKIFGPLTFKQFVYLAGGGGTSFLIWSFIPIRIIAIFLIVPIAGLALALAFYKVNSRSFILVLESAFHYFLSSKLFIWRKRENKPTLGLPISANPKGINIPKLSASKLKDLSWSLDVKENVK